MKRNVGDSGISGFLQLMNTAKWSFINEMLVFMQQLAEQ